MAKVTIIGATGNVGMFAAHAISAIPHVSEILLYGREGRESLLKGITQDLGDSFAARGTDMRVNWTTNLKDVAGSDVVVMTAGAPRTPGQDRMDLAMGNAKIVAPLVPDNRRNRPEYEDSHGDQPGRCHDLCCPEIFRAETQPGVRSWHASRFDAPQVAYRILFPCPCERSAHPYYR